MPIIYEFEEMEDAEAFVSEVKTKFGQNGQAFNSNDEAKRHTHFPWVLYPPVVLIDRVWADNDAEAIAIQQRFALTDLEIHEKRKDYAHLGTLNPTVCAVADLAEDKIEQLAREFNDEFVGT